MENNFDYNFFKDATNAAKANIGKALPGACFGAFRLFAISVNDSLRKDYLEKEKQKEALAEEYSPKRVQEKGAALDEIYTQTVNGKKEVLNRVLDKLANNESNAIRKFAMIPPTQEGILKIENAEKRIDTISNTEWLMLTEDASRNYQEAALLHAIAAKHGRDYDIPFEPEEATKNLDRLVSMLKSDVIKYIGEDPLEHLNMATFFRHEDGKEIYGEINLLAKYFDDLPVAAVTDAVSELTDETDLETRLLAARQICWNGNARNLWEEILAVKRDIQEHGLNDVNANKAEKLIKIVNETFPGETDNA